MRAGRTAKRLRQESAEKRQAEHEEALRIHKESKATKVATNDMGAEGGAKGTMRTSTSDSE